MSLPHHLQETFSPEEIQFIVENQSIKIFPRITTSKRRTRTGGSNDAQNIENDMNSWRMITMKSNSLNNMLAMKSTEVTLWLALLLKQQSKCNIIIPNWLTLNSLDSQVQYERKHPDRFSALPWDWLVLSEILFKRASDDFNDPIHELRGRIQDLKEIRQAKVLKGLKYLNESHLQLDNLSLMEINELRPFIIDVMNKLRQIHASANPIEGNTEDMDMEGDDFDFGTKNSESSRVN